MESSRSTSSLVTASRAQLFLLGFILFVSGFCSLTYQVVWLREFRLIFGGATPAASAVLAVFMGGLGLGGAVLGRWVETVRSPGRFYAFIEVGITVSAVMTPVLLWLVGGLYTMTGGIQTMGLTAATFAQIGMTVLVLGIPCFLMGGTLPAALKFAQSNKDTRRATTAVFYGVNIAGAVSGAFLATFLMLGVGGNQLTLMTAGFANFCIAMLALMGLRHGRGRLGALPPESRAGKVEFQRQAPPVFIFIAAFTSGFVFFLIELVWYRASIPLFGGSVYNLGLILSVALAGMGIGSLCYAFLLRHLRPTLAGFALVSSLLALCILIPFAMGDYLAHLALLLNNFFQQRSFEGMVFGWTVICLILVFLPAFFAGIQFPLMVSLLGKGNPGISTQLGRTYACNTLGAVSGALLGGFLLIPMLGVKGSWRLAAALALVISLVAIGLQLFGGWKGGRVPALIRTLPAAVVVFLALAIVGLAAGPSAYWFHHPIGYGRANDFYGHPYSTWKDDVRRVNRSMVATRDGRETSVALANSNEYAIFTNGKSDSSAVGDAPTTVMLGLVGAALHPGEVKNVCVIGLGTGVTVGWLNQVEEVERVDVIELESATVEMSRAFGAVNFDAMEHPKAHFIQGDAREVFVTRGNTYDLIISEPSNLHRAGVANLYTREFYEATAGRMNEGAVFCQWVQAYEADLESLYLVIATLRSVFDKVELWRTMQTDLLLVCSNEVEPWDGPKVEARLQSEPFRSAIRRFWGTDTLEGFLAMSFGNHLFSEHLAARMNFVNTDDLNLLEFAFGRSVGVTDRGILQSLAEAADERGEMVPWIAGEGFSLDPEQWARERIWQNFVFSESIFLPSPVGGMDAWSPALRREEEFLVSQGRLDPDERLMFWPQEAEVEAARVYRVQQMALANDPDFDLALEGIVEDWPVDAKIFEGLRADAAGDVVEAADYFIEALLMGQENPWVRRRMLSLLYGRLDGYFQHHIDALEGKLPDYFEVLSRPLASGALTDRHRALMTRIAVHLPLDYQLRTVEAWGEHYPWNEEMLTFRLHVWEQSGHPQLDLARGELRRFLGHMGRGMEGVQAEGIEPMDEELEGDPAVEEDEPGEL